MLDQSPVPAPRLDLPLSCADHIVQIPWSDLPLACPLPGSSLWNAHPRVYLPIHENGRATCPYCGTVYMMQSPDPSDAPPHITNIRIEKRFHRAEQKLIGAAAAKE